MKLARGLPFRTFGIFVLAAAVGVGGGLLAVGFQRFLGVLQEFALGASGGIVDAGRGLSSWERALTPAVGGIVAGLLLTLARSRGPFGINDIVLLVATRKDRIRPLRSLAQIMSSAASIATGSSIGKEGANSQLAATVATVLGHVYRTDTRTRAVLLGCGVAAGMACSYNAPIAGALFVMEVVLGNFAMDVFAPVVVSAVSAILVQRAFVADVPLYLHTVELRNPGLVVSAILLGGLCGFGAIVFRRSLGFGASLFRRSRLPLMLAMPIGGLLVGIIGIWLPEVWGNGYGALQIITDEGAAPTMTMLAALVVLKIVATALSTGSGALGGVFTPNLVVGAALGAFFASLVQVVVPSTGDHRIAFALVGMAGLCAATTHAPITAVILVFELTQDYQLILPLMLCSIIGSITARLLDRDSIYTARLRAVGHTEATGLEELAMQTTFVSDLMRQDVVKVIDTATFDVVMDKFNSTRRDSIAVVDANGGMVGHIHIHDIKFYMNDPTLSSVVIAADLSRPTPSVFPDETLAQILDRFDDPDMDDVAVVERPPSTRLLGRLTRRDVIACLSEEVLQTRRLRAKLRRSGSDAASYVELPPDSELARVPVPIELHGRALDSADIAGTAGLNPLLVITPREDGTEERVLATPGTVLQPGSSLIVLGRPERIAAYRKGDGK